MMTCNCEHTERQVRKPTCVRCAKPLPPWALTEDYARGWYRALQLPDELAEEALRRLRRGAEVYGWNRFLDANNEREAVEELIDALHYSMFATLQSFRDGSDEGHDTRRVLLERAARQTMGALRDFQAAAKYR